MNERALCMMITVLSLIQLHGGCSDDAPRPRLARRRRTTSKAAKQPAVKRPRKAPNARLKTSTPSPTQRQPRPRSLALPVPRVRQE
ncbi:MAG TPA: hypothetical protein VK473_00430 [Terriglobales bacterium]|nr:hypothetical protein [Terriglobales bacterium]